MAEKSGQIGLLAATIIGINAMIGAGIFAMPAQLSGIVGPASIFSFMLCSVIILSIVFPLGRLAQLYPGEGWGYRYPALWGGHLLGLVTSLAYIAGVIIAMGFLVQQAGVWLTQYIPLSANLIGVGMLAAIIVLVLAGTQISTWGQYLIALCVFVPLGLTSVVCWTHMKPSLMTPFAPHGYRSVLSALPVVIFSLLGFESIASLYRVVRNPQRNVPLAAVLSVFAVVGMYILFVSGAMIAIPANSFAAGVNQAFSDVLVGVLPQFSFMRSIITIGAFFAIFGTLHSMIWSVAELLFDVTRKVKSSWFKAILRRGILCERGCIWVTGLATVACTLFLRAGVIFNIVPLLIVPAYGLSIIALLFNAGEWRNGKNSTALAALVSVGGLVYLGLSNLL